MSSSARLMVNGEIREYADSHLPATVAELLEQLALPVDMVVAEVNGDIVNRDAFGRHPLADGDTVEIVRFVGGG